MDKKTQEQNNYCNLTQWHNSNFTGKGVTVWVMEGYTSHSRSCQRRVKEAAPDANVIIASPGRSLRNGQLLSYNAYEYDDKGNKSDPIPVEEFIKTRNIKIITSSTAPDSFGNFGTTIGDYWAELIKKYDLKIFCCSANDSDKDKDFSKNIAWKVGALVLRKDNYIIAGYSNGGEGLDFADMVGWWNGTSSSTPYLAGKAAVLQQRYPNMTHDEMYEYMKNNCKDFGDPGEDKKYGHGLFIFPDVNKQWTGASNESHNKKEDLISTNPLITTTKVLVNGKEKLVKRVIVDNENYIRLRDMDDILGICKVDYDKEKKLPTITK